jgi:hypothetical protein
MRNLGEGHKFPLFWVGSAGLTKRNKIVHKGINNLSSGQLPTIVPCVAMHTTGAAHCTHCLHTLLTHIAHITHTHTHTHTRTHTHQHTHAHTRMHTHLKAVGRTSRRATPSIIPATRPKIIPKASVSDVRSPNAPHAWRHILRHTHKAASMDGQPFGI